MLLVFYMTLHVEHVAVRVIEFLELVPLFVLNERDEQLDCLLFYPFFQVKNLYRE